ncbi:MAG: histidine kinase [Bacteroidota bacterium]|nr:histidine kinase [Bacteroidota bacterium]
MKGRLRSPIGDGQIEVFRGGFHNTYYYLPLKINGPHIPMYLLRLPLRLPLLMTILLSLGSRISAQDIDEDNFTHYTKQDGLSHNSITGIMQDSTGYIWLATPSGLNRFNGSGFLQIHSSSDSSSLPGEFVRGLAWLDCHRLAAYSNGLHIIDTRTGKTRNLFVPYPIKHFQYKFNGIRCVKSDEAGNIFVLTESGFYQFDKDYRLVFRFDYYRPDQLSSAYFAFGRGILWLDPQRLMVITDAGIYSYIIGTRSFRKMEAADCPLLKEYLDRPVGKQEFFQDKPGSFFILDDDGDSLVYIDPARKRRTLVRLPFQHARDEFDFRSELVAVSDTLLYINGHVSGFFKIRFDPHTGAMAFYPKKYFASYYCHNLFRDKDHTLWIGTTQGLFRQDYGRSYVRQAPVPSSLMADHPNLSMDDVFLLGNKLYVAARGNGGLLTFDKEPFRFTGRMGFRPRPKASESTYSDADNAYNVTFENDSNILVGTNGPLFRVNTGTGMKSVIPLEKWDAGNEWIADTYRDRNGHIWIATSEHVYKYDLKSGRPTLISTGNEPYDRIQETNLVYGDTSGNIWIAGHGLYRYNCSAGVFDRLIDSFPFIKMPDRRVNTFLCDPSNNLWIGSYNNGLFYYNQKKGVTHYFTRNNGLPDDNVQAMILIGNKLWLGTFSGIACLDTETFRITSFGKEDGFPDLPISNGAKFAYDTGKNKLYIGFSDVLVQFDPDIIYKKSPRPHLFIEGVRTGDQQEHHYPETNVTTSWRNSEIRVTIGTINFFTSSSQRFAYRLVQDDSTPWQQLCGENEFTISSLPPGHHRMQVKLFSADNRWPEQVRELDIQVLPPFWKQTWFIMIGVILLLLIIYRILSWRTGLALKREQAKTHIQKLLADEYKNQFELEQISNYFSSSLADKRTVNEVLWDVARNLIGKMKYIDCIIYMWNENKTKMVQMAAYGPKGTPKAIKEQAFDVLPGQGIVGHVMLTKEALLIGNTQEDGRYRIDDVMRLSEICVPIIHNDELIGIIDAEHPMENYYKERDLKILTTIATLVGNKIKQIESERSLEIKQKEISLVNQQLAEAQLSALQTQMNPHFIFNSLNSIKGMILANEQQKASRYLSKFAQMIRMTLSQSKETFTTLYENLEQLENYLIMEKLRFDDSFAFSVTVGSDIDKEEVLMPTLMIQPLAENAIWHGLMPKKGEKKLSVHFSRDGETILCTITDNGIGIRQSEYLKLLNRSPHQSVGLNNLRNRINIMNEKYDTHCTLEITDLGDSGEDQTGTRVILRFNIITYKPTV